jgi:hypothetical protein
MTSTRRVVTWSVTGKSVIVSDAPAPNAHSYRGTPGFSSSIVWSTPSAPSTQLPSAEPAPPRMQVLPAPGETRLMIFTFPPISVFSIPHFDPGCGHPNWTKSPLYRGQKSFWRQDWHRNHALRLICRSASAPIAEVIIGRNEFGSCVDTADN